MTTPSQADEPVGSECIKCGAEVTPTAKFCPDCGAAQMQAAPPQIKCIACGAKIPESASFCYKCGASPPSAPTSSPEHVGDGAAPRWLEMSPGLEGSAVSGRVYHSSVDPPLSSTTTNRTPEPPKAEGVDERTSNRRKGILFLIAAVVVVVVAIAASHPFTPAKQQITWPVAQQSTTPAPTTSPDATPVQQSTSPSSSPVTGTPPPVDYKNGIAIGIPRTTSIAGQAVEVNFGGDNYKGITVMCKGAISLSGDSDAYHPPPLRSGECRPTLTQGVPVRFHFIAGDPLFHLYTIPDEFENPKPSEVSIWDYLPNSQMLTEFRNLKFRGFHAPDSNSVLGNGWSQVQGTATIVTIHESYGIDIPVFRFSVAGSSTTLDLACEGITIIDRTNTRFSEDYGMYVHLPVCVPINQMKLVTLTTDQGHFYLLGVSNQEEEVTRPYYRWMTWP
jgi:ribosomal protein L40E